MFDKSHVLPECLGNSSQQVLPPGIVCKPCNGYFGSKIEPVLLDFPPVHVFAALTGVVDPGDGKPFREKVFGTAPVPAGPFSEIAVRVTTRAAAPTELRLDVLKPVDAALQRTYRTKDLRVLSRAIHKLALEALAWNLFVRGNPNPIDIFHADFNHARNWARYGEPQAQPRPAVWRPSQKLIGGWTVRVPARPDAVLVEFKLFIDLYGADLTSPPDTVSVAIKEHRSVKGAYCIEDGFHKIA